jgi:hypothetical protein
VSYGRPEKPWFLPCTSICPCNARTKILQSPWLLQDDILIYSSFTNAAASPHADRPLTSTVVDFHVIGHRRRGGGSRVVRPPVASRTGGTHLARDGFRGGGHHVDDGCGAAFRAEENIAIAVRIARGIAQGAYLARPAARVVEGASPLVGSPAGTGVAARRDGTLLLRVGSGF